MGRLKVLPAQIANMIAAGEVVQRPASVVKELLENAVDAGADQISVVVTDAGRTLIQVIDNGCGMSPSDAVLCFERHATSKIATAEDLGNILTYGFRGEALASIAAVAEVTLKTRRADDDTATQVTVGAGGAVKTASVAAPSGSNFAVRNLFYNTPARRKFLKSDSVEFRHIIEEFTRVAIPHPEIGFTLSHNGREVFVLKKAKSLKFRILDLLGSNVVGDIVDLSAETSVVQVSGFVGRPDAARKTLGNQYFFMDGRYFRSAYLHKAVMKAYEEMIAEGVTPSYFIFLQIDPHAVDVNIHPTKNEIKFEDDSLIFQILYASVKETLGRNSFGASIDFDTEGAVELPNIGRGFEEYKGGMAAPSTELDPSYDPFNFGTMAGTGYGVSKYVSKDENYGALFADRTLQGARTMVLQGRYVLTPVQSGVMVVNVRRARERILYEQFLKALSEQAHVTQTALFPVEVQVGAQAVTLFEENAEMLARIGFDIHPSGVGSVTVEGVPEGYSCSPGEVERTVADVLAVLSEGTGGLPEMVRQNLAEKFAVLGASGAEKLSDPLEARRLIDLLFACENAEVTPGGHRIVVIVGIDEIEKRF
ncbi:MAG: DNA mismatch repair endonuclease MutL [Bacteroidales bacterium]|nr:DNA mismatch repair endonuclease MutL [Bacteroidales bacterium]